MSEGSFDYIIVGAGSAGCVLANRLTASGKHRVLLLEAGRNDRYPWIHVPLGYGKLFTNPRVNWIFNTEPSRNSTAATIVQPRGKVLGGSSLDQRPDLHPRPSRGLRSLAPARQYRLELRRRAAVFPQGRRPGARRRRTSRRRRAARGRPIRASRIRSATPLSRPRSRPAFRATTISTAPSRKARATSSSRCATGRRCVDRARLSASRREARQPRGGDGALATRVLFEGRRAVGVEYRQDGATHTARAKAKCCSRPAPSTRRSCCSFPASVRRAAAPARHRRRRRLAGRRRGLQDHFRAASLS